MKCNLGALNPEPGTYHFRSRKVLQRIFTFQALMPSALDLSDLRPQTSVLYSSLSALDLASDPHHPTSDLCHHPLFRKEAVLESLVDPFDRLTASYGTTVGEMPVAVPELVGFIEF